MLVLHLCFDTRHGVGTFDQEAEDLAVTGFDVYLAGILPIALQMKKGWRQGQGVHYGLVIVHSMVRLYLG